MSPGYAICLLCAGGMQLRWTWNPPLCGGDVGAGVCVSQLLGLSESLCARYRSMCVPYSKHLVLAGDMTNAPQGEGR